MGGAVFCVAPGKVRSVQRDLEHAYGLHVRVDHDQAAIERVTSDMVARILALRLPYIFIDRGADHGMKN